MPNPKGNVETLKPFEKTYKGNDALSTKPLSVKVSQRIDTAIRALPDKGKWLRRVITEAAERELMEANQ